LYHEYAVPALRRNELAAYLRQHCAGVGVYYPSPCYLQPALELLGYSGWDLTATERIADEILALPIYPELSSEQRRYVVDKIRGFHAG
jgi:dTDP-4-amino-4,6-dideoxygalactose transaminase